MSMRIPGRGYAVLLLIGAGMAAVLLGEVLRPHASGTPAATQMPQGRSLFDAHCAVCHGPTGKGDGPGARVVRQPMRDFSDREAMQEVDDRFLVEITKKGSSQFGRSNAMPAWGMKLSDEKIRAIVSYIRSLAAPSQPGPSRRKR